MSWINAVAMGISAIGQLSEGSQANSAGKRQSELHRERAKMVKLNAARRLNAERKRQATAQSAMMARSAASGTAVQGSHFEIIQDSLINSERDILTNRFNSKVEENAILNKANLARWQGKNQLRSSLFKGTASVLQAGGSAVKAYEGYKAANAEKSGKKGS